MDRSGDRKDPANQHEWLPGNAFEKRRCIPEDRAGTLTCKNKNSFCSEYNLFSTIELRHNVAPEKGYATEWPARILKSSAIASRIVR